MRGALAATRLLPLLAAAAAAGCSTYVLEGRVVEGAAPDMYFVETDDPQLAEPPINGVRVTVDRDHDKLSSHLAGHGASDQHGRFSVSLDEFGSGWMDETWLIRASKPGYRTAESILRLGPSTREQWLLIVLPRGASDVPRREDLMEEYERYR